MNNESIASDNVSINKQIMECEKLLLDYDDPNHVDNIDKLLHDDLIFNIFDGSVLDKPTLMEIHHSEQVEITSFSTSDYKVSVIDDSVVVSMIGMMNANYGKKVISNAKFQYIRVWKLFKNEWKVIAAMQSSLDDNE